MATNRFRGDAPDVAQVNTVTVGGTAANGQVYTVTINGKTVTYTATGVDTNTTIAASLQGNLNTSIIPEFVEVVWTVATTIVTGTARTPGIPFTNTSSATGTGTLVTAIATASSGHQDVSTTANWTTGSLPGNADTAVFDMPNTNAFYGLTALAAVSPIIQINPSFNGQIGLPDINQSGSYYEYRQKYLQIVSTSCTINSSATFVRLDFGGTSSVALNVLALGNPTILGVPYALIVKGTGASSTFNIQQGSAALAYGLGDTTTFATISIGSETNPASDVTLYATTGLTWTTMNQSGGIVTLQSNGTTWNMPTLGTAALLGTATLTTLNGNGSGTFYWQSTGTITTWNGGGKFTLDTSQNISARTLTNANVNVGTTLNDPSFSITCTNGYVMGVGCGLEDLNFTAGKNRTVKLS